MDSQPIQETTEDHQARVYHRSASTMAKGSFGKQNSKAWDYDEEAMRKKEGAMRKKENEALFMANNKGLFEDLGLRRPIDRALSMQFSTTIGETAPRPSFGRTLSMDISHSSAKGALI